MTRRITRRVVLRDLSVAAAGRARGLSAKSFDVFPARHLEHHTVTGDVVLHAEEEVTAGGVEHAASSLRTEVIQGDDLGADIREPVQVQPVIDAGPDVVVAAELGSFAVLVDDPVATYRLISDVVRHREIRIVCNQRLILGYRRAAAVVDRIGDARDELARRGNDYRLVDRAVSDAEGFAIGECLPILAGVRAAEAHEAARERRLVDIVVFGPIVGGELEQRRGGTQVATCDGRRANDQAFDHFDPYAAPGLRALTEVGVTGAPAESQTEDATTHEGRLAQTRDLTRAGARQFGDELEVRAATDPVPGTILIAEVHDAARVNRDAFERQFAQRAAPDDVPGIRTARSRAVGRNHDVGRVQRIDQLEHPTAGAGFFAEHDRPPRRDFSGIAG